MSYTLSVIVVTGSFRGAGVFGAILRGFTRC